jgi:hypothetical protein
VVGIEEGGQGVAASNFVVRHRGTII